MQVNNQLILLCFNFAIFLHRNFVSLEPRGLAQDMTKQHTGLSTESVGKSVKPSHCLAWQAIAIDRQTGIVRVHVADAPQDEDAFDLVPSLDTAGRITHACRSVNIPDEFLPRDCTKVQAK